MINKSPIYQQLNSYLKNLISGGEYKSGEKFLTERAICERFGVSRATANKALSSLVSEGVLEFKKGIGTFIRNRKFSYLVDFRKSAESCGLVSGEVLLSANRVSGEPDWDEDVFRIEKLATADGKAYILIIQELSARLCSDLPDPPPAGDVNEIFLNYCGIPAVKAETIVRSRQADGREASLLEAGSSSALFAIETKAFLPEGKTAWREVRIFKPGSLEFLYSPEVGSPGNAIGYRLIFSENHSFTSTN
ncbi:MAG: GntR family transcriptional regulator [Spirochaetales bacterium]|nr:GntR family transcriptional regulator [Spirochaetales bacterium]